MILARGLREKGTPTYDNTIPYGQDQLPKVKVFPPPL